MRKILISACLMGYDCRYKGDNCKHERILDLYKDDILIPLCPEQLGGLSTPRLPAERVNDKIIAKSGKDVSVEYNRGADIAVEIAKRNNVDFCIMKANSPSCGKGVIYDGTFTGGKKDGNGVTVDKLLQAGFKVISEDEL